MGFLMLIPFLFGIVVVAGMGIAALEGFLHLAQRDIDREEQKIEEESIPEWKRRMRTSGQEAKEEEAWNRLLQRLR